MVNQIGFAQYNPNSLADFSPLAKLGEVYREAQNRDKLSALGKQLAGGSMDYRSAAGQTADMGDIGSTLKFIALAEQQRKEQLGLQASQQFASGIGGMLGGKSATDTIAPVAAVPNAAADEAPARAPVASSPTTWGDREATAAGLYPSDTPMPRPRPPGAGPGATDVQPPISAAPPIAPAPAFNERFAAAQPAAAPSIADGPTVAHIPMLLSALANPNLPEAQKELAKDLWKRAWDNAKPTEKIQTLQGLRDNPDLLAIEKDLRKSQATSVNMLPGEKAQDVEMGKTLGELHAGYIKEALKSNSNRNNLDAAERAMSQPGFASGTAAPAILAAQRALVGLGIGDAEKAAPNELFQKLQNKAVMDSGGSASGLGPQISNNDAKIIRDSTFNSTNTPEGNRRIIGFQRLLEDRKVDYTREMNRYAKDHGGRIDIGVVEHMADWAEKNPLNFEKVPGYAPPPTPEEYAAELARRNEARKQKGLPPL